MKKIKTTVLIALCAILLTGCNKPVNTANAQVQQLIENQQPKNNPHMSRVYFDGHYYIKYVYGYRFVTVSITHDPDCPCREKGGSDD